MHILQIFTPGYFLRLQLLHNYFTHDISHTIIQTLSKSFLSSSIPRFDYHLPLLFTNLDSQLPIHPDCPPRFQENLRCYSSSHFKTLHPETRKNTLLQWYPASLTNMHSELHRKHLKTYKGDLLRLLPQEPSSKKAKTSQDGTDDSTELGSDKNHLAKSQEAFANYSKNFVEIWRGKPSQNVLGILHEISELVRMSRDNMTISPMVKASVVRLAGMKLDS